MNFNNITAFLDASKDDLLEINDIGPVASNFILEFLAEKENIKLVKTEDLTDEERSKQRFTKRFFKKIDASGLNIDDLRIDTDLVDIDSDGVEEKIIIVRQREVVE